MAAQTQSRGEERRIFFDRIYSFYELKILAVAFEWRLATRLAERGMTSDELAEATALPARSVRALLYSLSAMGLVRCEGGVYSPTEPGARFLVEGSPECMRDEVRFAELQFDALTRLRESIREGAVILDTMAHYLHEPGEAQSRQAEFDGGLAGSQALVARALLTHVDLSTARRVLDLGGNAGGVCAHLLKKNPRLEATVFDLAHVVPLALATAHANGLDGRLTATSGDFMKDPLPAGYDVITFTRVLCGHPRHEIVHVLRKAYEALPPGGRAVGYELAADEESTIPEQSAWGFLFPLLWSQHGEAYAKNEWRAMFAEAGFSDVTMQGKHKWSIFVATKDDPATRRPENEPA
jgi:3-hydroxy-5-methyl-1-naphthoate 3-O-methyltransferase